jgi:ATP-dependent DNA helicase RecG
MNKKALNQILQKGEGQFVELKENFDKDLAKEIVAFANASGGKIFLGIGDDNKITGISITNRLKSQITDMAKNCDPQIFPELEELENILIINVPEGDNKPYQCARGFYLRLGPNTQKLTRDEILKFSIKENIIRFDEQVCPRFDFKDFDDEKFEYYLKLANISKILDKKDILRNLRVLTEDGMTNAGILFFAKNPYKYIFASRVRCVLFKGNERVDILDKKEVDKGIIGNIEFAFNYLKEHVPVRFEIKGLKRIEYPQFHEDAYREAIVNAVIHRDYYESGEVAVEKFSDMIVINNPGGLVPSFPLEEFGKLSWPRNRLLADLMSKTIFMERVGTGIRRIRKFCKENNNEVEIKPTPTHFFVKMKAFDHPSADRIKYGVKYGVNDGVNDGVKAGVKLNENQKKILNLIMENENITREGLSEKIGISINGIEKNIAKLKAKGLLKRIGPDKTGYWKVENWVKEDEKDGVKYGVNYGVKYGVKLNETQKRILNLIMEDKNITREGLSEKIGISISGIEKNIAKLKEKGLLTRVGPDKTGYWKLL